MTKGVKRRAQKISQSAKPELVSVIMPLYNAKPYLKQTIDSVLGQSLTNYHLYIIDDQSNDGSAQIAQQYQRRFPDRITYLRAPQRGGRPSVAKNIGISISRGRLIAFIDHDDWWKEDHLSDLVEVLEGDESVGLVGDNAIIYDNATGQSLGVFWSNPEKIARINLELETLYQPPFVTSSCTMFRRRVFDELGPIDQSEALWMSDDHEIAMRIVLDHHYKVVVLPKVNTYRRWLAESLSNVGGTASSALSDVEYIYQKFSHRRDLSEPERATLENFYQMSRRRRANLLIAAGDYQKARRVYRTLKHQGKFQLPVLLIRVLLAIWPTLAKKIVTAKRSWSFHHPELR